ncbi:MAG: S24/S26 family peptidase [Bacteroidales bacterium]|jgi:signal peptidase I|nr:S24/S26 family peptidase [Bacteroidales bacterium]
MDKLVIDNDILFPEVLSLLDKGKQVVIPCKGVSMLPFIRQGLDTVKLEKAGSVKRGDIVLFVYKGKYVLHRVWKIERDTALMMGDGVLKNREKCRTTDIYGKAVEILKNGSRPVFPDSSVEKLKAELWRLLLPLRRYLLAAIRLLPEYRRSVNFFRNA